MSDESMTEILSPTSPTVANAVFGSARPRRPSTPKSPPAGLKLVQPQTPSRTEKSLPPIPGPTQARSQKAKKLPPTHTRPGGRPDSPDVETMIARTPRPRRKSSATFHNTPMGTKMVPGGAMPSSWKGVKRKEDDNESVLSDYGTLLKDEEFSEEEKQDDGDESDSSIDIHTPLPHLMFRDGLLSPRSKLLPGGGTSTLSIYEDDDTPGNRANSVLSLASTVGSTMTKSGIHRDPRDTQRRRNRHKDQTLLRAGMGLTTGLGWSDSEDEDAPSMLTRRLINTSMERQTSIYSSISRAPSQLSKSISVGNLSHAPPSYSPVPRSGSRGLTRSTSVSFSNNRLSTADSESVASSDAPPRPARSRTQSNASASSIVSSGSRDSSSAPQSVTSSQATPPRAAVPRPLRLPQVAGMQQPSVARTTTSATESRPPVSSGASKLHHGAAARPRTRTLSNPGSRPPPPATPTRAAAAASRIVPPRSVSTSIMAPVRSMSTSISTGSDRHSVFSSDTLSEFPLPPSVSPTHGVSRPSVNTRVQKPVPVTSPASPPSASRVLNTVGTGPRPRPRTGTGMVYRNSSYSSYLEGSRISRASIASSSGKEVGVI